MAESNNLSSRPDVDVIIVGAGLSGIDAAYRIQSETHLTYTILEARTSLGGTWDLFHYPGVRSDSEMYTFGFSWYRWPNPESFGSGEAIEAYLKDAAALYGIDRHIRYGQKVVLASWSSPHQLWRLRLNVNEEDNASQPWLSARFVIFATGYYDYESPLQTVIPGLEDFRGTVVHPQFWPSSLDHADKRIVVIGSGATAVTLVPELAKTAAKVFMLQRSPTYVFSVLNISSMDSFCSRHLPARLAYNTIRWKNILMQTVIFEGCRAFPTASKAWLKRETCKQLPASVPYDPNFKPSYNPWDQRLCVARDGDLFSALRGGNAEIVTATVRDMMNNSILLEDGSSIPDVDIIVTATGLKVQMIGGIPLLLDGEQVIMHDRLLWNGVMLQDVPNAAFLVGSTHGSWTLRIDNKMRLICRVIKSALQCEATAVTPRMGANTKLQTRPLLNLSSTYLRVVEDELPKAADRSPWKPESSFYREYLKSRFGSVRDGLEYSRLKEILV